MWWTKGRTLGNGAFGRVFIADIHSDTYEVGLNLPHTVAVKSAPTTQCGSLVREKVLLLNVFQDCPNIVRCYGSAVSHELGEETYNVLLEYASGGSLDYRIKRVSGNGRGLPEKEVKSYTRSTLAGLSHIHNHGYVHRDIKPANILLFGGAGETTAKIADFGLARNIVHEKKQYGLRGTAMYMAPESITGNIYEPSSDIWALGCSVLQMITGKPPWTWDPKTTDPCALVFQIGFKDKLPEIPNWVPADAKDFLSKCLVRDPKLRWTADELLTHRFLVSKRNRDCDFNGGINSIDYYILPYVLIGKHTTIKDQGRNIDGSSYESSVECAVWKKAKPTAEEEEEEEEASEVNEESTLLCYPDFIPL